MKLFLTYLFVFISLFTKLSSQEWPQETLKNMSLREKIGQLFIVATNPNNNKAHEISHTDQFPYTMHHEYIEMIIRNYAVGGLIYLGPIAMKEQLACTNKFQSISKLPLIFAQDCEWGIGMRVHDVCNLPRAMTLGSLADSSTLYTVGHHIAQQCKAMGIHICLGPVCDVNNNPKNPIIAQRSFGDNPSAVAEKSILLMRGIQDGGILAVAKHAPGHGDTETDSHETLPIINKTKEQLIQNELIPFKEIINAHIGGIMTAHIAVPQLTNNKIIPASCSYAITTELIKRELGFDKFIITDALGMKGISNYFTPTQAALEAFKAGNDILLCPVDVPGAIEQFEKAIHGNEISVQELDARVFKILQLKKAFNLPQDRMLDVKKSMKEIELLHTKELSQKLFNASLILLNKSHYQAQDINEKTVVIEIGKPMSSALKESFKQKNAALYSLDSQNEINQLSVSSLIKKIAAAFIALYDIDKTKKQWGMNDTVNNLISQFLENNIPCTTILFGAPYAAHYITEKSPIIIAHENNELAQNAVALFLNGQIDAVGKMPVNF